MLSVVIGNDIKDVEKINIIINELDKTNPTEASTEEAIDWLKDIHTILTAKDFGQDLYDPSELLD